MRQLPLPFGAEANAAVPRTGGAVSAAMAGAAAVNSAVPVAMAHSAFGHGPRTKSFIEFPLLAYPDGPVRAPIKRRAEPNQPEARMSTSTIGLLSAKRNSPALPYRAVCALDWEPGPAHSAPEWPNQRRRTVLTTPP